MLGFDYGRLTDFFSSRHWAINDNENTTQPCLCQKHTLHFRKPHHYAFLLFSKVIVGHIHRAGVTLYTAVN